MGSDPRHATGAVSPDTLRAGRFVDPHGTPLLIGILSCEKYRERAEAIAALGQAMADTANNQSQVRPYLATAA